MITIPQTLHHSDYGRNSNIARKYSERRTSSSSSSRVHTLLAAGRH